MNFIKVNLILSFVLFSAIQATQAACIYEKLIYAEEIAVGVMLNWTTETEEDNSMFVVEKSLDGIDFSEVGTVEGAGNSFEVKKYSFLDVMAKAEKIFYRLKQVDFDGSHEFSDVLSIDKKGENQFMVVRMSSIAAFDKFDVTLNSSTEGALTYSLTDAKGAVVEDGKARMLVGLNYLNIDLMDKVPGIYRLEICLGEEKEVLTFKRMNEDLVHPNFASKNKKND